MDIENEGLIYFDTAVDFEAFLEENGIDSNKGLSFEEIKPLLDMGVKGILLKEDVVSRQRNELKVIDGSIIKGISFGVTFQPSGSSSFMFPLMLSLPAFAFTVIVLSLSLLKI